MTVERLLICISHFAHLHAATPGHCQCPFINVFIINGVPGGVGLS